MTINIEPLLKDPSINFTKDQQNMILSVNKFLNSQDNILIVDGAAGTGKTFIISKIVEFLCKNDSNFVNQNQLLYMAAPTGKASLVLEKKMGNLGINFTPRTIHSLIYEPIDKLQYGAHLDNEDDNLDKVIFKLRHNRDFRNSVYFFDESSMISNVEMEADWVVFGSGKLLDDLIEHTLKENPNSGNKVIFVGDNHQLPPVGMNTSPAMSIAYLNQNYPDLKVSKCSLTEVVRQKVDSNILKSAHGIIHSIDGKIYNKFIIEEDLKDIKKFKELNELIIGYEKAIVKKPDCAVIICRTNVECANLNSLIRERQFGDINKLYEGDKLICNTNSNLYYISNGQIGFVTKILSDTEIHKVIINFRHNQEEQFNHFENINVKRLSDVKVEVTLRFRKIEIAFDNRSFNCMIIENLLFSESRELSRAERIGLYVDFMIRHNNPKGDEKARAIIEDRYIHALQCKFGHAITCHKAQGSEWDYVLIKNHPPKSLNEEYLRWAYTALTRCKRKLGLYAFNDIKPWSGIINKKNKINEEGNIALNNSNTDTPLETLRKRVKEILDEFSIKIISVNSHMYNESYQVESTDKQNIKINIYYNGKHVISNITISPPLLPNLVNLKLNTLKNTKLDAKVDDKTIQSKLDSLDDFIKEFINYIEPNLSKLDIKLVDIHKFDWNVRLIYSNSNENALIDVFFDKKNRISDFRSVGQESENNLTKKIMDIINQNM